MPAVKRSKSPSPQSVLPFVPPSAWPASTAERPARLFVGTSGWAYPTWRPGFYPEGLSPARFLPFYASRLNTVEVNYTFRQLPAASAVDAWLRATPPGFRLSFKAPQGITHFKRLRDCEELTSAFLASIQPVADAGRLGLVLFQLPPNLPVDLPRLQRFLTIAPLRPCIAMAFEFRHASWFRPEVYRLLEQHNAAVCIADTDTLATPEVHTGVSHACFRLRRDGGYTADELAVFAERFARLAETREVYVHLRHQEEPTGALNAEALLRLALLEHSRGDQPT